jgi:hypothetical protein
MPCTLLLIRSRLTRISNADSLYYENASSAVYWIVYVDILKGHPRCLQKGVTSPQQLAISDSHQVPSES